MAVRSLTPPTTRRSRGSRFQFNEKEIADSVKMLQDGKTPGVGPFKNDDEDKALREARSQASALQRECQAHLGEDVALGTRAWLGDEGAFAIVRVKD